MLVKPLYTVQLLTVTAIGGGGGGGGSSYDFTKCHHYSQEYTDNSFKNNVKIKL